MSNNIRRKPMKKSLIYIIVSLFFCKAAFADDSHPYFYKSVEDWEGAELVFTDSEDANPEETYAFLLRPSWAGESEQISVWKGISGGKKRGAAYGGVRFLATYRLKSSLLAVWSENDRLFAGLIDTLANIVSLSELHGTKSELRSLNVRWIQSNRDDKIPLLVNDDLYICSVNDEAISIRFVSSSVKNAIVLESDSLPLVYVAKNGGWTEAVFANFSGEEKLAARLRLPYLIYLVRIGDRLGIVSTTKRANSCWMHLIDSEKGVLTKYDIETNGEFVKSVNDGEVKIVFLKGDKDGYTLVVSDFKGLGRKRSKEISEAPPGFFEPKGICVKEETVYVLFRNGLSSFDLDGNCLSADSYPFGEYFDGVPKLYRKGEYLIVSSSGSSVVFKRGENSLWRLNRFAHNFGKVVIPLIFVLIVAIFYVSNRRLKRQLRALMETSPSGAAFILDKNGRLREANKTGRSILKMTKDVPRRRFFHYYCDPDENNALKELVELALQKRDSFNRKINLQYNSEEKEWFFSAIAIKSFAGNFKGIVLTGVDITEELERRRLTNWAQLAHDMQTNLTTIRLNAESLRCDEDVENDKRRGKILHQAALLIQRVRDIVTVGRGEKPEVERVSALEICYEAKSEFDEAIFPNVEFKLDVNDFELECDKKMMVRAMRNAIENGIRALNKQPGKIFISNRKDSRFAYFSVKDTGVGMDEDKRERMMKPYFTSSKKEGGMGIGTMIMQNVIEKHDGKFLVNTELGEGTEILFCLPLTRRES